MDHFVAEGNHVEARIFIECLSHASGGKPVHDQAQTRGRINAGLLLGNKFDPDTVIMRYVLKTRSLPSRTP